MLARTGAPCVLVVEEFGLCVKRPAVAVSRPFRHSVSRFPKPHLRAQFPSALLCVTSSAGSVLPCFPPEGLVSRFRLICAQPYLVVSALFIMRKGYESSFFRISKQVRKRAVSIVGFVKARINATNGLLDQRTPKRIVISLQRAHDFE